MRTARFAPADILAAFARKKVLTRAELLQTCGCSPMTAWRLLRRQGYLTSYNHNARYYTLARIPQFDEWGLWACRDVRFSQWGNLPQTLLGLIERGPAGRTARELEELLHLRNVKPALSRLSGQSRVARLRIAGALVYFSGQRARREGQLRQRQAEIAAQRLARPLPDPAHVLALLVEIIRHPRQTPRQWARRLARQGIRLGTAEMGAVLEHYGLSVKKGLLSS
jgi:hypothetical protein